MPELLIDTIAFNHDPLSHHQDGLNIRRDVLTPVIVPEWQRGISLAPGDSCAAYSMQDVADQTLTIRASFIALDPTLRRVEIRALDQSPLAPDLSGLGGILGPVGARPVNFAPGGASAPELFELPAHQLGSFGVGVHIVSWWWQYRRAAGDAWTTFALTTHTIYVVLATPKAPWEQVGYPQNSQLPWTEVLDVACRWARGTITPNRAATRVAEAVFSLGGELLEYNCPNFGAPMYVSLDVGPPPYLFNCSAFLERLHGGPGRGRYVNCSDCATIVSTFANILGCDLSQSRMGALPPGFVLNPILAIGAGSWGQPCGFWPGFGMHEVAWSGECTDDDEIYDACLALDAAENPVDLPHFGFVPTAIVFAGPDRYRDRLVEPAFQQRVTPWTDARQRRRVI